jgi:hypothetical protein
MLSTLRSTPAIVCRYITPHAGSKNYRALAKMLARALVEPLSVEEAKVWVACAVYDTLLAMIHCSVCGYCEHSTYLQYLLMHEAVTSTLLDRKWSKQ